MREEPYKEVVMLRYLLLGYALSVITTSFVLVHSFLQMRRLAKSTGESPYTMMYRIMYGKHRVPARTDWFVVILGYVASAFFWFFMFPLLYISSRRGGKVELSPHAMTNMAVALQHEQHVKDLQDYRDCVLARAYHLERGEDEKVKAIESLMSRIWWRLPKATREKLLDETETPEKDRT